MMKTKSKIYSQIKEELDLLRGGLKPPWGRISILLDLIDTSGYWREEASPSFTHWLKKNAADLGSKPATLWRILSAGRFLRQLLVAFQDIEDIAIPQLDSLPRKLGPEKIELLGKISRVLPPDKFILLLKRVFSTEVKSVELRTIWQDYRIAVEGKTTRGRGTWVPTVNWHDPYLCHALVNSIVFSKLRYPCCEWSGYELSDISEYNLYKDVHVRRDSGNQGGPYFACIIRIHLKNGESQYHGFRVLDPPNALPEFELVVHIKEMQQYCDFFWFIVSVVEGKPEVDTSNFPASIGLMSSQPEVQVLRQAQKMSAPKRDRLMDSLISRLRKAGER